MTARTKTGTIPHLINSIIDSNGWTQRDLADRIGMTQGHLSKVMRGLVPPGRSLRSRLESLSRAKRRSELEPWLERVRLAAVKSREARSAIEAIARLVNAPRK